MNSVHRKSLLVLALISGVLLLCGYLLLASRGLLLAFILASIFNFSVWWFSDRVLPLLYSARRIKAHENPRLYNIVREVADAAQMPMPAVYVIPSTDPHAFASGRNASNASLSATGGLLNLLDDDQLREVLAKEIDEHFTSRSDEKH